MSSLWCVVGRNSEPCSAVSRPGRGWAASALVPVPLARFGGVPTRETKVPSALAGCGVPAGPEPASLQGR